MCFVTLGFIKTGLCNIISPIILPLKSALENHPVLHCLAYYITNRKEWEYSVSK